MPAKLIITAAAVGLLVFAGAVAVDAGITESGDTHTFNETFNESLGDVAVLAESNRDPVRYLRGGDIRVKNESGKLMFDSTDYDWLASNGTLEVLSQRLANDTATVKYGYVVASDDMQNISSVVGSGMRVGTLLIWVVTTAFVVAGMRAMGAI